MSHFGNFRALMGLIVFSVLLPLPNAGAYPVTTETCGKSNVGVTDFSYCVFPTDDTNNKDLIIHFHGLGGSASTWKSNRYYELMRREVVGMGRSLPTVVTISLGKLWLLTEVAAKNNRYAVVMNSIIPFLKNLAGYKAEGRLMLMGESMGGFNSMQILFRNPNMFAKVALICPVVADLSPWSSQQEIKDYIRRTGAQTLRVKFFVNVAAEEFRTPFDWQTHNPLMLAQRLEFSSSDVYLSADENDEYGFYEGATLLNAIFSLRFNRFQFETIARGGHCDMNPRAIARFLTSP